MKNSRRSSWRVPRTIYGKCRGILEKSLEEFLEEFLEIFFKESIVPGRISNHKQSAERNYWKNLRWSSIKKCGRISETKKKIDQFLVVFMKSLCRSFCYSFWRNFWTRPYKKFWKNRRICGGILGSFSKAISRGKFTS